MSRLGMISVAAVTLALASAGLSAGPTRAQTTTDQPAQLFDEAYFLRAADEAVTGADTDTVVQLYQSAIIYAPGDPVPYEKLAEYFVHSDQPELAQRYFNLALDVQPAYAPALQGLALLDLAAGNRAGAQQQHEILVRSCGANCPETAQVEKALNSGPRP
jgi:tetratricopeptide (TPR) repeat protein